jgi:hypothetical protein
MKTQTFTSSKITMLLPLLPITGLFSYLLHQQYNLPPHLSSLILSHGPSLVAVSNTALIYNLITHKFNILAVVYLIVSVWWMARLGAVDVERYGSWEVATVGYLVVAVVAVVWGLVRAAGRDSDESEDEEGMEEIELVYGMQRLP